jgi:hypothetical protein
MLDETEGGAECRGTVWVARLLNLPPCVSAGAPKPGFEVSQFGVDCAKEQMLFLISLSPSPLSDGARLRRTVRGDQPA